MRLWIEVGAVGALAVGLLMYFGLPSPEQVSKWWNQRKK